MLAYMLEGLDGGTFTVTRAEYTQLRSVCTEWRRELILKLCPKTSISARYSASYERFWECPFPLAVEGAVKVDTWEQLAALAHRGHIVHTMHMNEAGQVSDPAGVCTAAYASICNRGARPTASEQALVPATTAAVVQMATYNEDAVTPFPSIRGLQRLALCDAEDALLDLSSLTDLQALCLNFRANGDPLYEVNHRLCEVYINALNIMQVDHLPLSILGLQVLDTRQLTSGLIIMLMQPGLGVKDLALYCPHGLFLNNMNGVLRLFSEIAATMAVRLNCECSRLHMHFFGQLILSRRTCMRAPALRASVRVASGWQARACLLRCSSKALRELPLGMHLPKAL